MSASQPAYFHLQEFSDLGAPLVGGRLYTYAQGTTALKTAYTDPAGAVPQTYTADGLGGQYIALNARGELPAPLYLATGAYDIALKRADGSTVWTRRADPTGDGMTALGATTGSSLIGFIQAGVGALLRTVQDKLRDSVGIKDFGALVDGVTDDTAAVQKAINTGKAVDFPDGTCIINGTLTGGSGLCLRGKGIGKTILKKTGAGHILDIHGVATLNNISLSGITFDCNLIDAGVSARYVSNVRVQQCEFKNSPFWGLVFGAVNSTLATIYNDGIVVTDCVFTNTTQTYEHLLVLNSRNVRVSGCDFSVAPDGIGIGIYQNVDDVRVSDCRFFNMKTAAYYSLSCSNIFFRNCKIDSTLAGIQGANLSDNGAFGATVAKNVNVLGCSFTNNTDCGLQLGAVQGASVIGCVFDSNKTKGLLINARGIGAAPALSSNIVVDGCIFRNNNTSNIASASAPGISFESIGGASHMSISNCMFIDDRGVPLQLYPIVFNGAFTWTDVIVSNSHVAAYGGALSIGLVGGAALGSNVLVVDCTGVSSTLSAGVLLRDAKAMWSTDQSGTGVSFSGSADVKMTVTAGATGTVIQDFGRAGATNSGRVVYDNGNNYEWYTGGTARLKLDSGGNLKPSTDNVYVLGTGSNRWNTVFAGTAVINTSDEREKQQIEPIGAAVLRAWSKVEFCQFKFNDAVQVKSDGARWHFGVIAQRVKAAFEFEGLDPFAYGVLCYDEWEEEPAVVAEDGTIEREARPAGNRFGIRYEEALALECAYLRSRLTGLA